MAIKLKPLKEQVIVITGASSGIGLATAKIAADKGARLVLACRSEHILDDIVNRINRGPASNLIEPSGEKGVGSEAIRVAGQVSEDGLGDFLSQLRRADLAERRGIDQVEVAADEFREGVFGMVPDIFCEQLQVGVAHLHRYIDASARNPPRSRQMLSSV